MKLLITGGSGYVGTMLADQFARRADVDAILLVDKEEIPSVFSNHSYKEKVVFVQANLSDNGWQEKAKAFAPDVIIHTAWQIREMYGMRDVQQKWNVEGSNNVFSLAFSLPSVKKLIYFSTISSYGAEPSNHIDHFFKEEEFFRRSDYLYAEEKRTVENNLKEMYERAERRPQVFVIRPASITGPRGRFSRIKFGLQTALAGKLLFFMPVTKKWMRQFVHEDDIVDIVEMLAFEESSEQFEIYNACPPGPVVLGKDMAEAVGKKAINIPAWLIRPIFFLAWHLSKGKIPTSKGGWKYYAYPIAVDGSKITRQRGYQYKYPSKQAFSSGEGRYKKIVK